MCATCFAQASVYVGGALGGLQVMASRVKAKRGAAASEVRPDDEAALSPFGGSPDAVLRAAQTPPE